MAALELATSAFTKAKSAKDCVTFDDAMKELHESFGRFPDERDRKLPGYLKAFKNCMLARSSTITTINWVYHSVTGSLIK
ncbi:hypothetical protein PGTUg99_024089 [Puccinia graminis f. sp. tritici]|uniref:Uncharacterized protein n=1 Tax=Puccinia graminis f. sp. tritici TaxID=56615 RepID=A0A5B0S8K9_PUCGR|nr:hypothetical protein PGTUg99_024089 [Puccinia graminis f. sp. tritici]